MYAINELEFTRVMPREDGIFAFAKYPHWWTEYNFLIQPDGVVKGKTNQGFWLEVSQELGTFVKEHVKFILGEEPSRIYA